MCKNNIKISQTSAKILFLSVFFSWKTIPKKLFKKKKRSKIERHITPPSCNPNHCEKKK
jgi:hypothetical protein